MSISQIKTDDARLTLRTKYEALLLNLLKIEQGRRHSETPMSKDSEDQAIERENDEVLDRLEEATRAQIDQVQHALERIRIGRYGACEHCNWPIELQRLTVMPEVTTCAHCATIDEDVGMAIH